MAGRVTRDQMALVERAVGALVAGERAERWRHEAAQSVAGRGGSWSSLYPRWRHGAMLDALEATRMGLEWRAAGEAGEVIAERTTREARAHARPLGAGGAMCEQARAARLARVAAETRMGATAQEVADGASLARDAADEAPGILAEQAPLWAQEPGSTVAEAVTLFYAADGRRVAWSARMASGYMVFGDAWAERALVGKGELSLALRSLAASADAVERSVTWQRATDARAAGGEWFVAEVMQHGARHFARKEAARKLAVARAGAQATTREGRVLGACRMDAHEACEETSMVGASVEVVCICKCHGEVAV